jgi:hypothetical protein
MASSGQPAVEDGGTFWQRQLRLRLTWARPVMTPSLGRLATRSSRKEPSILARSERLLARSDEDDGVAAGCGDGEQRARLRPVGVVGEELVWAGLRCRCRKQHACSRIYKQQLRSHLKEGEEELTQSRFVALPIKICL